MACTTGDKLKASAREFLKNLETWKSQEEMPASLEVAIHRLFGSCTTGPGVSRGAGEEQTVMTRQSRDGQAVRRKLQSNHPMIVRMNKGSQTNKAKAEYGEHIYEQLFQDDRGNKLEPDQVEPVDTPNSRANVQLRQPFSSPFPKDPKDPSPKMLPASGRQNNALKTPLNSDHLIVPKNTNFDDSISAISAYTLNAMVHAKHSESKRVSSLKSSESRDDSTLFPESCNEDHLSPQVSRIKSQSSGLERNRSQQTHSSNSKLSRTSKTTHTTEDSSFERRFAEDEKKYWTKQAGTKYSRSKSQSSRTNDYTASTSSPSASFVHPHDVIPYEPSDLIPSMNEDGEDGEDFILNADFASAFANDPDRLAQVLFVPVDVDTEIAEI